MEEMCRARRGGRAQSFHACPGGTTAQTLHVPTNQKLIKSSWWRVFMELNPPPHPGGQGVGLKSLTFQSLGLSGDHPPRHLISIDSGVF